MDGVLPGREGVDRLLADGSRLRLHNPRTRDPFLGMPAVVKYRPDVRVVLPPVLRPQQGAAEIVRPQGRGRRDGARPAPALSPDALPSPSTSRSFLQDPRGAGPYVNVEGKGIVTITGCWPPRRARAARLREGELRRVRRLPRVYGGLHIAPFEEWGPPQDELLDKLQGFNVRKFACNHCTGETAVRKMRERGMPWPAARRATAARASSTRGTATRSTSDSTRSMSA